MAIEQYIEQPLHEPVLDEGNVITALQSNGKTFVTQERHPTSKSVGTERQVSPLTIGKGSLKNVERGMWQPPDLILFLIAVMYMVIGLLVFKRYLVLPSELERGSKA